MNNITRLFLSLLVGLGAIAAAETAGAQTAEKPVPRTPYLTPVPDYAHWVVTFTYETPPADGTGSGNATPLPIVAGLPKTIDTIKNRRPEIGCGDVAERHNPAIYLPGRLGALLDAERSRTQHRNAIPLALPPTTRRVMCCSMDLRSTPRPLRMSPI